MDPLDTLGYWLRCIRYEEALAARPRAQRSDSDRRRPVNMKEPVSEREYIKISANDAALLLEETGPPVILPLEGEVADFFEAQLAKQYRFEATEAEGPEIMVLFPAVHLSRGLLAGLIRFEVSVHFFNADHTRFEIPSRAARRRGALPPPPTQLRIHRLPTEEGPPFFLDPRLLTLELGVLPEELEELFSTWHRLSTGDGPPSAYLATLLPLFGVAPPQEPDVRLLCEKLFEATDARIRENARTARCYNVALTADTGRLRTTAHLQREMNALIRHSIDLDECSVLSTYLRRQPLPSAPMPLLGLISGQSITASQKQAAERFLGSALTAVEGPPGTGKTTLILHLCAHRLVTRIARYVESGVMPSSITAVVSTNNRAVDNAVERARTQVSDHVPFVFRVGSRRVCEAVSSPEIGAVIEMLSAALPDKKTHLARLKSAEKAFRSPYKKLRRMLAPEQARAEALLKKQQIEADIRQIEAVIGTVRPADLPSAVAVNAALEVITRLEASFTRLSEKCEKRPTAKSAAEVVRYFETHTARILQKFEKAAARIGILSEPLFRSPKTEGVDPKTVLFLWEDASEAGIDKALEMREALEEMRRQIEAFAALGRLKASLLEIRIPEVPPANPLVADRLRHAVFEAASAVRASYLTAHADEYLAALAAVKERLETAQSMRRIKPALRQKLQELFPVWGCTLLSMGNIFEEAPNTIEEVIIDEAGQCHPAYAVSALLRCNRALVLGDVHQLTPVYNLSEPEERPLIRGAFCSTHGAADTSLGDPATTMAKSIEIIRVYDKSTASVQRLAQAADAASLRLTDHFRCRPEIIEISNRLCHYALTVHTPPRSRGDLVPFLTHPVLFLPTCGEAERDGGSRFNAADVEVICKLVEIMLKMGIRANEIAVITPYRAQLLRLRRSLVSRGIPLEQTAELTEAGEAELLGDGEPSGICAGTVHRFQGGERSVVLFSTVVTTPGQLGFLNERVNLLNVAVSRAADHLIVVGNEAALKKGLLTRTLLEDAVRLPPEWAKM